jgi:hypothetical protein
MHIRLARIAVVVAITASLLTAVHAAAPDTLLVNGKSVKVPRVSKTPTVEDFLEMRPNAEWSGKMVLIENFTQRAPKDGDPARSRTNVYLGYDDKSFYTIFVCFDDDPKSVRSRMARRDTIGPEDDEVQLYLDTFNDKRRSYGFMTNPRGIQFDYLWTEERAYDVSFDTVWQSAAKQTEQGWVAMMMVPFKSMRFPTTPEQTWGILLQRVVPRTNENLFWPPVTERISGRLNQEGTAAGLERISPGRNMQFIPYVAGRSFRAPDLRDPSNPRFSSAKFRGDAGLDAKMVIKDSFVFDVALNPDFSQVESDQPQVTVNQRFEVFFPEKRPFFLENSDYFATPIDLLFTRRIADPQLGLRLTGKTGPYKLAALFADDQSPGRSVVDSDPLHGKRAYFGVFRGGRDVGSQGSVSVMYTHREFEGEHNRVGSIDTRLKWKENWSFEGQAAISNDKSFGLPEVNGTTYNAWLDYTGKKVQANTMYIDTSENFLTRTGFFRRPDIRRWSNFARYRWYPEGNFVVNHGPQIFTEHIWDHSGTKLYDFGNANYEFQLPRTTFVGAYVNYSTETLRPVDFATLTANTTYSTARRGVYLNSFFFPMLTINSEFIWGTRLNFVPAPGQPPIVSDTNDIFLQATVKPISALTIDNTYLLTRLRSRQTGASSFTDHVIRSKWNYQFTRELSLRFIAQYTSTLANPNFTELSTVKNFNTDVLVTWLLNPGTAIYVGYNTNMANPDPTFVGPGVAENRFINDARGLFVKASYLFRF